MSTIFVPGKRKGLPYRGKHPLKRRRRRPTPRKRGFRPDHKEVILVGPATIECPLVPDWPYGPGIENGGSPSDVMYYESVGLPSYYSWFTPNSSKFGVVKGKKPWKPFSHYRIGVHRFTDPLPSFRLPFKWNVPIEDFPVSGWITGITDANIASSFGAQGQWIDNLPPYITAEDSGERKVTLSEGRETYKHWALRQMLYPSRSELSSVNSLIELKDFLSIGESVHKMVNALKHFSLIFHGTKWERSKTLRELLRAAADGWLQLKFNFQPLVSDMLAVQQALLRHNDRIVRLLAQRGQIQIRHFVREFSEFPDSSETDPLAVVRLAPSNHTASLGVIYCDVIRDVANDPTTFHAQVRFTTQYSELQVAQAKLLSLLDSLDVVFDPAIVWNAIPWSFVVDWFVKVGDWFRDFRVPWMKPTVHVLEYLQSFKRRRRISIRLDTSRYAGHGRRVVVEYPTIVETSYDRQVGGLDASSLETSGLSLTEFSLAAALAISKAGQRKQRRRVQSRVRRGINAQNRRAVRR